LPWVIFEIIFPPLINPVIFSRKKHKKGEEGESGTEGGEPGTEDDDDSDSSKSGESKAPTESESAGPAVGGDSAGNFRGMYRQGLLLFSNLEGKSSEQLALVLKILI